MKATNLPALARRFAFFLSRHLALLTAAFLTAEASTAHGEEPIRALMITGGGWHDYEAQKEILAEGIRSRANVEWTVIHEGTEGDTDRRSRHKVSLQQKPNWNESFDVVLYNICFSNVTDVGFIEDITQVHADGLPAVVLHCSLHSYRSAETDAWRELLGVVSNRHEQHRPVTVENIAPEHPIMKAFPEQWKTPHGELYVIEQFHDTATPLAQAYGIDTEQNHATIWTNQYGDARVFGTSLGHHNETMAAEEYLDVVTRGLLWSVGKLKNDGSPAAGFESAANEKQHLVLVAGRPSHSRGTHEHNAGVRIFEQCLKHVNGLEVTAHYNGWPEDPGAFDGADGILFYMDGGGRHPVLEGERLRDMKALIAEGVGVAAFHYAVEVPRDRGGEEFLQWIGGYYETHYSVNPVWTADFSNIPEHPITRGVQPFEVRDEWYFNIRFRPHMTRITPILQAKPSDETRDGPYVAPPGPYPHVVDAKGATETVAWAVERDDGGRGFGFTGGHFHKNWGHPDFRKTALNALVWIAGGEVPPDGVECEVSHDSLDKHLDP